MLALVLASHCSACSELPARARARAHAGVTAEVPYCRGLLRRPVKGGWVRGTRAARAAPAPLIAIATPPLPAADFALAPLRAGSRCCPHQRHHLSP